MEVCRGDLSLQNDSSTVRQNGGPIAEAARQDGGQRGLDMRIVKGASCESGEVLLEPTKGRKGIAVNGLRDGGTEI